MKFLDVIRQRLSLRPLLNWTNKDIFYYACDMLNIAPSQSVFIDDNKKNVQAANSLGMCGHWYKSYATFLKFIADF